MFVTGYVWAESSVILLGLHQVTLMIELMLILNKIKEGLQASQESKTAAEKTYVQRRKILYIGLATIDTVILAVTILLTGLGKKLCDQDTKQIGSVNLFLQDAILNEVMFPIITFMMITVLFLLIRKIRNFELEQQMKAEQKLLKNISIVWVIAYTIVTAYSIYSQVVCFDRDQVCLETER